MRFHLAAFVAVFAVSVGVSQAQIGDVISSAVQGGASVGDVITSGAVSVGEEITSGAAGAFTTVTSFGGSVVTTVINGGSSVVSDASSGAEGGVSQASSTLSTSASGSGNGALGMYSPFNTNGNLLTFGGMAVAGLAGAGVVFL